jgi:hypothetical protein
MPQGFGNIQNYITTSTCSSVLSMGCYIEAPNGWYSDGTYAYYISGYYIIEINYDPCYTPPPPPTPPVDTYTQFYDCNGDVWYIAGDYTLGSYLSNEVPYQCLVGGFTTTSPSGTQLYSIFAGDCGGCP